MIAGKDFAFRLQVDRPKGQRRSDADRSPSGAGQECSSPWDRPAAGSPLLQASGLHSWGPRSCGNRVCGLSRTFARFQKGADRIAGHPLVKIGWVARSAARSPDGRSRAARSLFGDIPRIRLLLRQGHRTETEPFLECPRNDAAIGKSVPCRDHVERLAPIFPGRHALDRPVETKAADIRCNSPVAGETAIDRGLRHPQQRRDTGRTQRGVGRTSPLPTSSIRNCYPAGARRRAAASHRYPCPAADRHAAERSRAVG